MSGSRPKPAPAHFAEQHLGDRLSALVDGELGHESRERVLAHLATCARCKAEADAQRRLKSVFAQAAPPPPSESFLARLQGLPGGGDTDGDGTSAPDGGLFGRGPEAGVFGMGRGERFEFGYVPASPAHSVAPEDRGFRIHPVGRPDADRSASRGLRFAFAAAGAVSLAALALGGVTTAIPGDMAVDARSGSGSGNVSPTRSAGTGAGAATPDSQRRRAVGPLLAQGSSLLGQTSVAPTSMSAPLVPGVPAPATGQVQDAVHDLTAPVMAGAAAVSPLIRPLSEIPPFSLTSGSASPRATGPGPLSAPVPVPDTASAPSVSPSHQAP
ncbi:anti-sigma factor [Streptomyces sp. BK340]|uniref:anti-sigma factor family protein n=1 Tax=Streptomyces sp. BK340 TaxID=2572903 RepID=UPI0011A9E2E0|nr:anti-sigma factor [Streptomyces sp. BK340]TVZ82846.1 putative zinc finger protein [Streptomyces sp. BK340]